MTYIEGGVTAAKGFKAAGLHAGIRRNKTKKDLALIACDVVCAAAMTLTKNVVRSAPVQLNSRYLADGRCRAIVANSGIANACAPDGAETAERMAACTAAALGIAAEDVAVASTGVIGQRLNVEAIEAAMPALAAALSSGGSHDAAEAIMTTDLVAKEAAVEFTLGGKPVKLGAIAKGSGMIHPNMGTMFCFYTTDCRIAAPMLQKALSAAVEQTFNRISVDGDTSPNDTCVLLASGLAGNDEIAAEGADFEAFSAALLDLSETMAKSLARDGEGATKLISCAVTGAESEADAVRLAKSVIGSSLVKTAMFGSDANWGRILCAMGYAGVPFNPEAVDIGFRSEAGEIAVCKAGRGLDFDEALAKKILVCDTVEIICAMAEGSASATAYGCDLSYDYVKINGDYRT